MGQPKAGLTCGGGIHFSFTGDREVKSLLLVGPQGEGVYESGGGAVF